MGAIVDPDGEVPVFLEENPYLHMGFESGIIKSLREGVIRMKNRSKSRKQTPWDDLQNYLNLYAFVINPPSDHHEKVEKIINLVFENPKSLKYRDQFS